MTVARRLICFARGGHDWHTAADKAGSVTTNWTRTTTKRSVLVRRSSSGEGRTRTGDTPVFSRVLYQLSYLAAAGRRSV